ncbi:MFS transporter [Cupriavidus basilensis]|uniref:MFS transporter n=1 Tax=Cupriavidus basilensis TaxID=68895 RepID=UPI0023E89FCA|nr:MFS transporter [Cupriavidus basilensis]MDF3884827.1 MFS transporter [Cupriavidus basilensis]
MPEESALHGASTAARRARRGIVLLTFAFALSQFYRSCLAVMAPELQHDFGLTAAGFGSLSSCFFLAFAVAQIPVGIAFDRYGVGKPTALLLAIGAVSSLLFTAAPNGTVAMLAQAGLGLACAPVFMGLLHFASEHLSERNYTRVVSQSNATGMIGALCATAPLGWAMHLLGWRVAMSFAALCMVVACYGVWRFVRDEGHAEARHVPLWPMLSQSAKLLAIAPLWTLIPMCVAMSAGTAFRNAWSGPYLANVYGLDSGARGVALALLSVSGFLTAFFLPVLVRRSSLKTTIAAWSCLAMTGAIFLTVWPASGMVSGVGLMALLSTIGMLHPLIMAQGRGLVPPSSRGRGLGVLNTFVFLGSALTSWGFGMIARMGELQRWPVSKTYATIFLAAAVMVVLAVVPYLFSPSPKRS